MAAALSLAATPGLAVATYEVSFANDDGSVDGTVSGRLTLPDGDGDRAATSLRVTSAPSELGFILPLDALTSFVRYFSNTFTVLGGEITAASFGADSDPTLPGSGGLGNGFALGTDATFGSALTIAASSGPGRLEGVWDLDGSSLRIERVAAIPVPGAAVLLLSGLAMVWGVRRAA